MYLIKIKIMKTINFLKGVIFYMTVIMACLTLCLDYDTISFTNLVLWFIVLATLGFCTYSYCKYSTEEELRSFTGVNYIKSKFGIDLLSED